MGLFFWSIAALGFSFGVHAQQQDSAVGQSYSVVSADVGLYEARVISQDGNKFNIGFDLVNREGVQPDVRYSVSLTQKISKGNQIVATKVYDEVLNMGANQTIHREITYVAPEFLSGTYTLLMKSFNGDNLPLATRIVGEVTLTGSGQYLFASNELCNITVQGEDPQTQYTIFQGVDVDRAETIIGTCKIRNTFTDAITASVQFRNYYRTVLTGKRVDTENVPQQTFSFAPGETKEISFTIPKASAPQAYDAMFELVSNGKVVSNEVPFHYVVRGESATIQNLRLDKDYYAQGDIAKISFGWTGSADMHMQTRKKGGTRSSDPALQFSIVDGSGKSCAQPVQMKAPQGELERMRMNEQTFSITSTCLNPSVSFSVLGDNGNVLAQKTVSIQSANAPALPQETSISESPKQDQRSTWVLYGIFALTVVSIGVLAIIFVRKRRGFTIWFAALLIGGGLLVGPKGVHALTVTNVYCDTDTHCLTTDVEVDLDKADRTYNSNEQLGMSATIQDAYCSNGSYFTAIVASKNMPKESSYQLILDGAQWGDSGMRYSTAAATGGTYKVKFNAKTSWVNDATDLTVDTANDTRTIYYTVRNSSCTLPWGGTIASGTSVQAYAASAVACGTSCVSQTRTCTNGVLSGAYTSQSCSATLSTGCPSASAVCSWVADVTDNCGNSCHYPGTKTDGACCVDTSWTPSESERCSGVSFTQTSNCTRTRTATGTQDCSKWQEVAPW